MDEFTKNKTVIVIAHRLSTVTDSYKIYCIENGMIMESGSHEELLETGGHYAKLYKTQFGIK